VSSPPENDRQRSSGPPGRGGGLPIGRAALVLVAFVVATVLLLGVIHPTTTSSSTGSAPAVSTTTTTTRPAHPASTTTTFPPSKVPVLVANASGVTGAAATVSNELQPGGWDLLPPVNATAHVTSSHVYYVAGQQQSAEAIATSLHLPASAVLPYTTAAPISSIGTADVLVVVGPDLATPSAATTTTVG
jgi:hypothetical protein